MQNSSKKQNTKKAVVKTTTKTATKTTKTVNKPVSKTTSKPVAKTASKPLASAKTTSKPVASPSKKTSNKSDVSVKTAMEIITYAIDNNISTSRASKLKGFGRNYVSNVKITLDERVSNSLVTVKDATAFKKAYARYEKTVK